MNVKIGKVIKEKRKSLGFTQEQLAEEVGINPSFIGQIERGKTSPGIDTLTRLTQILSIDANQYFYDDADQQTEYREFYLMFNRLSPNMRELAQVILKQIYKQDR